VSSHDRTAALFSFASTSSFEVASGVSIKADLNSIAGQFTPGPLGASFGSDADG
jgi:hypothetical protein